jgi:hypothetical protein
MRRLLVPLLVLLASLPLSPAAAQPEDAVTLHLLSQTDWNGPIRDHRRLDVTVRAVNRTAAPLADLSLSLSVYAPVRGRLEYEASLSDEATVFLFGHSRTYGGTMDPGESRDFVVGDPLEQLLERDEAGVYPMTLELRSEEVPLAVVRSPIVFVTPQDEVVPLAVAPTFVLGERLHEDPTGAFEDRVLEAAVAEDGSLRTLVQTLASTDGLAATVAVSPLLLRQLSDMTGGYRVVGDNPGQVPAPGAGPRGAAATLDTLKQVLAGSSVELASYPFAAPSFPALAAGGLDSDIGRQLLRGDELTQKILGTAPDARFVRPPFGLLDAASIKALRGAVKDVVPTLLMDAGTAIAPEDSSGNDFSPAATGRARSRGEELPAVLPNEDLHAVLDGIPDDPVLRAHAAIGELAVIYGERPGVNRAISVLFPETDPPEAAFVRPFLAALDSIPFLDSVAASELLRRVPPEAVLPLVDKTVPHFTLDYEEAIRGARDAIARYQSMFPGEEVRAAEFASHILLAESHQFVRDEDAGRGFLDGVVAAVRERTSKIEAPPEGNLYTLPSRNERVPLQVRNLTGTTARVRITLISSALQFPDGASKQLTLEPGLNTQFFDVQARRGGKFPVDVVICAWEASESRCVPDSPEELASSQIVIRSTAYNKVALFLTIAAALFLLAGWGRRVLRRGRT